MRLCDAEGFVLDLDLRHGITLCLESTPERCYIYVRYETSGPLGQLRSMKTYAGKTIQVLDIFAIFLGVLLSCQNIRPHCLSCRYHSCISCNCGLRSFTADILLHLSTKCSASFTTRIYAPMILQQFQSVTPLSRVGQAASKQVHLQALLTGDLTVYKTRDPIFHLSLPQT